MKKKKRRLDLFDLFYLFRLLATFVFLIFVILLLPNIQKASWQGSLFLLVVIIFIGVTLWMLLLKEKKCNRSLSLNLLILASVFYVGLIFSKLFFDERVKLTMIYEIDLQYFKNNYFFLSIILIGIIFHALVLIYHTIHQKNAKRKL